MTETEEYYNKNITSNILHLEENDIIHIEYNPEVITLDEALKIHKNIEAMFPNNKVVTTAKNIISFKLEGETE